MHEQESSHPQRPGALDAAEAPAPVGGRATQADGVAGATAHFRLFVAGETARSLRAATHLRRLCSAALGRDYELEIIDVLARPDLADEAHILATPTVVKLAPVPLRRVVGDLSDAARLASALDLELADPGSQGEQR